MNCISINLCLVKWDWPKAPTFGDVLRAKNANDQPSKKLQNLPELKDYFNQPKWDLLKKMNKSVNIELHSELPSDPLGRTRFVTFSTDETKAMFQQIATKTDIVFAPEDLEVVDPASDSSGNGL